MTIHRSLRMVPLMLLAAGATAVSPAGAASARATVIAGPVAPVVGYATRTVVVVAGDGVDFLNADSVFHNVVADQLDSFGHPLFRSASGGETIGPAQRMSIVGVEALGPGIYTFHCTPHPNMTGSLIVQAA